MSYIKFLELTIFEISLRFVNGKQRQKGKVPVWDDYANCVRMLEKCKQKSLFLPLRTSARSASTRLRFVLISAQVNLFYNAVTLQFKTLRSSLTC